MFAGAQAFFFIDYIVYWQWIEEEGEVGLRGRCVMEGCVAVLGRGFELSGWRGIFARSWLNAAAAERIYRLSRRTVECHGWELSSFLATVTGFVGVDSFRCHGALRELRPSPATVSTISLPQSSYFRMVW